MGSSLMRALSPAQPEEPSDTVIMPVQSTSVPPDDVPNNTPADEEIPVSPRISETGPSIVEDPNVHLTPPPGNWTEIQDDLYSQRQQAHEEHHPPSLDNLEPSTPGTVPKARGPPLSVTEARQSGVTITVPLPLRQRFNPHVPPPRINVPIPKMPYMFNPKYAGVPFPAIQMARNPYGVEVSQAPRPPSGLPSQRQVRTIRVPLRAPPPTPPIPMRQREEDARLQRPPFNVFTPVPGIARSPDVVGVPYSGATSTFTTPRNPIPVYRNPAPAGLILRPRRLDFEERPAPRIRVTGTEPSRVWQPTFEISPEEFLVENTMTVHPNETSISPTSPGEHIPDPHLSTETIEGILSGMIESPYPLGMLIGTPIPPATPDRLSTDEEHDAPSHPGITTLYAPAEGITTSSLDPRRDIASERENHTLDNITPDAHQETVDSTSVNPAMPEQSLSVLPPIETMEIGIGNSPDEHLPVVTAHDPQATGAGPSDSTAHDTQATGAGPTQNTSVVPRSSGLEPHSETSQVPSEAHAIEQTDISRISLEASGTGPTQDSQQDPIVAQTDHTVGTAASSSSRPNREAPGESVGVSLEPPSSDSNTTAQNNLRSLMADLANAPLEGQPPPQSEDVSMEPDAEPPNPKYNQAWSNFEGKLIILSGHPNSGKSTVIEELVQLFQLYKTKSNRSVWCFTDTQDIKTANRTLLHFTNDSFWTKDHTAIDFVRLMQSYESIRRNHSPKAITVIEGHRMFLCTELILKCNLLVWLHTPSKTRRSRGKRIPDQEWNRKLSDCAQYHKKIEKLLESKFVQILCGLDTARKNAMLLLAMMVIRRDGPLKQGATKQYVAPNMNVSRMIDPDYDDWLLDRHEPINVNHAIRDHLLDTPWEPPTSASVAS